MNEQNPPAIVGQVERPVGPLARMTMSEEAWMLRNPYALRLLMDYHDQDRAQAESMMDADELGHWPSARFTALYERGRSIMAEDLDCWDADLLRAFGFPERPNLELCGAARRPRSEAGSQASARTTSWADTPQKG